MFIWCKETLCSSCFDTSDLIFIELQLIFTIHQIFFHRHSKGGNYLYLVFFRLHEHVNDKSKLPILIFPEGNYYYTVLYMCIFILHVCHLPICHTIFEIHCIGILCIDTNYSIIVSLMLMRINMTVNVNSKSDRISDMQMVTVNHCLMINI